MTAQERADFEIPLGNKEPIIRQRLTFEGPIDLTGATVKFRYKPEGSSATPTERTAAFVAGSFVGGQGAATGCDVGYPWVDGDVSVAGRFDFQWKITKQDGTVLHRPAKAPTARQPDRVWQVFEVTPVI